MIGGVTVRSLERTMPPAGSAAERLAKTTSVSRTGVTMIEELRERTGDPQPVRYGRGRVPVFRVEKMGLEVN